jgi:bromodomain-containing protein 7/9
MYGPFGSFAPTYDTAFASLTKHDSSLLLSTYGSELGISYANSLQQFVRGCGTFASEMGDAILNSLTNGRHVKFLETLRQKDEQKKKLESEELSLNCKEDRFKDDKDDNIDRKNENTGDELLDSEYQDTNMTDQLPLDQSSGISVCLTRTTQLLEELDQQQSKRLGQLSVETYNKEFTLPQPSKNELETASQLTSELVTLVSQVICFILSLSHLYLICFACRLNQVNWCHLLLYNKQWEALMTNLIKILSLYVF